MSKLKIRININGILINFVTLEKEKPKSERPTSGSSETTKFSVLTRSLWWIDEKYSVTLSSGEYPNLNIPFIGLWNINMNVNNLQPWLFGFATTRWCGTNEAERSGKEVRLGCCSWAYFRALLRAGPRFRFVGVCLRDCSGVQRQPVYQMSVLLMVQFVHVKKSCVLDAFSCAQWGRKKLGWSKSDLDLLSHLSRKKARDNELRPIIRCTFSTSI